MGMPPHGLEQGSSEGDAEVESRRTKKEGFTRNGGSSTGLVTGAAKVVFYEPLWRTGCGFNEGLACKSVMKVTEKLRVLVHVSVRP